jgi:pyruvate,water dikinase
MDPGKPLELIASYADQDLDRLDGFERQSRRERRNAARRVRRNLSGDPERLRRFDDALAMATNQVRFMEDHNYLMEQCTHGSLREAIYETGKALVARDMIDEPDDVLHISLQELKEIDSDSKPGDLRSLVRQRSLKRQQRAKQQPPQTLGKGPAPTNPFDPGALGAALPEGVGLDGNLIRGVGASRGRVSGAARLALPGAESPKLNPGDILIAENVGPEWTPMFGILGGLVLDQGAAYQHAALVAREYRLPAVIQTKNATASVREGQRIVVDGDKGIVELGEEGQ